MASSSFLDLLGKGLVLLDGAIGTEFMRAGVVGDGPSEALLLSNPDSVRAVHAGYAGAGSQTVYTNSFGANRIKLVKVGLADRMGELNRIAVELARSAAPGKLIIGSMSSTGELLEPYGDLDEDDAAAALKGQAEALVKAGVDAIVAETYSDLKEALLAVKAAQAASAPAILVTMTFEGEKQKYRTVMGVTPEQAVEALREAGADAVGANCGGDTPGMVTVISRMRAADGAVPLIAKPNAGFPYSVAGKTVYPMGPDEFAETGARLRDAGASLIGGCCGTTPEHIKALAKKLGIA